MEDFKRKILSEKTLHSCFFRTSVEAPYRKALIKITDKCNLHCVHCFVSATKHGDSMSISDVTEILIPNLKRCNVISATLTGGEPFAHADILEIVEKLVSAGISTSICTNATLTTESQILRLKEIGNTSINISLDGFSPGSHGLFRGDKKSFYQTIKTIELFAKHGLLKGLLITPNKLINTDEYNFIYDFALKNDAKYILLNPLSNYGRGVKSKSIFSASQNIMNEIKEIAQKYKNEVDTTLIRFPNTEKIPLSSCEAGNIVYIFVNGELTVCPYLVFAAKTPDSKHSPDEFIVGNIFSDLDIDVKLKQYVLREKYDLGGNNICKNCNNNLQCGKGCPAAIISSGQEIEGIDKEVCPKY
ncbi:radical SAM protein [Runella limosa]|uniref:radical SAM protein n=1 Tax=Runella limosa TaxID=370978 RepID=UPI0004182A7F|nr:radical SAM protein [Runella limosa]